MQQLDDEKSVIRWIQKLTALTIKGFLMTLCGVIRSNTSDLSAYP